ncbi:MAG: type II secretion system F family protein [Kiritimatiellia bacterium]|nr:type II secretion system F family protein [Kiritimatiellia bacterium]
MYWVICSLFMLTFTGLAYMLMQALFSGAETYASEYSATTARQFEDIFVFIPPKRIAEAGWAASAVVFLLVFLLTASLSSKQGIIVGVVLATVAGGMALQTPRLLLTVMKQRRLRKFNIQLVDTLVSMSNALRAGFSITQTFESVAKNGENPIAQEFDLFLQQTRVGVSFTDALENLERRVGSDDLTLVVQSIEIARQTGGNLTEIFEKIASTIRERMRIENRIRTLTAQGRLQGIVVGAMPAIIALALLVVDPELMKPFLHSTVGLATMIGVVILVTCGGLIIRKIIRIDV